MGVQFSPSTWALGVKRRTAGLVAGIFLCWATHFALISKGTESLPAMHLPVNLTTTDTQSIALSSRLYLVLGVEPKASHTLDMFSYRGATSAPSLFFVLN